VLALVPAPGRRNDLAQVGVLGHPPQRFFCLGRGRHEHGRVTWAARDDRVLDFPGGDNYVDCGNVDIGPSLTLAYWCFNPEKAFERPIGQHSGNYTADPGWAVYSRNEAEGGVWFRVHGADDAWDGGDIIIPDNLSKTEWYHLTFTFDGPTRELKGYLNGELKAEKICEPGRSIYPNSNDLRFGNVGTGETFSGMLDEIAIWDTGLTAEEVLEIFLLGPEVIDPRQAGAPDPEHEAVDVPRDTTLNWTPGTYAGTHDVYFGGTFEDVNGASRANSLDVLVSQGQDAETYNPGRLEFSQTYYWRVDEVNATPDNTIITGRVWSFMTEPLAYPIATVLATSNGTFDAGVGPERTVDGSGLNADDQHSTVAADMWLAAPGAEPLHIQYEFDRVYKLHEMRVWNYNVQFELMLGFGLKDATVEYSADGAEWVVLGDVQLAQATAKSDYMANTAIALGGVAAKFVRLIVNSGYGPMGQFGLSEVRFMQIPAYAREPEPADGATEVRVDTVLAWRAGRDAAAHEVYLSTDEQAMVEGSALIDTVSTTALVPANLEFGNVYYWKINEVNEAEAVVSWEGDIWSFAIQAFAVIDDMENYDDEENRIFDTWLDGFVNETGSTVGYFEAPFAEKAIVNSGRQSMPLEYDNTTAPFYSEAELDVGSLNLDTNGADSLRLFIAGQADNAPNPVYLALEDTSGNVAAVTHPDPGITAQSGWTEWLIPYSDLIGINLSNVSTMFIGVGSRDNPTAGGSGLIFVDDIGYGRPAAVE